MRPEGFYLEKGSGFYLVKGSGFYLVEGFPGRFGGGLSAAAEERELAALQGDATLGYIEILLVQLEADIMPA